jgi:hypothetical protein
MVISSPVVMLVNPVLPATAAAPASPLPTINSIPSAPSTIGQDGKEGDFTTQAALQIPRAFQSTDIVSSTGIYEVTFITSTTGAIDKIEIVFPPGTNVGPSGVIEKVGIGGGTLTKVGSTLTYEVTTPVSIPAGTFIRLEIVNVKNPSNPSTTFTATITTRDSGGAIIDGPSSTNVYSLRQIGTNDIADSSITSSKPNEGFMKRVTLQDNAAGNALGWNPNGVSTLFTISESAIVMHDEVFFIIEVREGPVVFSHPDCGVATHSAEEETFTVACAASAPSDGSELHYVVGNLPPHVP